MLSKIENNQFEEVEPIDMAKFLDKKISNFEELIEMKEIKLTKFYDGHPTLILNNTLTYVLITNLINNAIKHNIEKGTIHIKLNDTELIIENTGRLTTEDPEKFFQRFKKGSTAHDSSGLGLALIKKVCEIYQMSIRYTVDKNIHKISIKF